MQAMKKNIKRQRFTHYVVSSVGGFLGSYAIFNFYEIFANAQTANMIHLVRDLFDADFGGLAYVLVSMLTYILGNAFCVLYRKFGRLELRTVSLALDALVILAVGIIINFTSTDFALLPIVFAAPIQWNAFSGDAGYASSTIFSTNNLRQATMSLTLYLTEGDKAHLSKSKFFWATLLVFHLGVALQCFASSVFGLRSIWLAYIPLFFATLAYCRQRRILQRLKRAKKYHS
jgi:uncharacterized membrane protein YoaK (UPF0700 family)